MSETTQLAPVRSEMELFIVIDGYGGLIHSTARGVSKGHIDEESGDKDINSSQAIIDDAMNELVQNYGIILPPEGPNSGFRYSEKPIPEPPEGKEWYWVWYFKMKKEFLQGEYDKHICSACALSSGDLNQFNTSIPCSVFRGIMNRLVVKSHCGMLPLGTGSLPRDHEWSKEQLLENIKGKGGEDAVTKFLNKEKELKAVELEEWKKKNA